MLINRIKNQRRNVLRMSDTKMKTGSFFPVYPELQEKEMVAINQSIKQASHGWVVWSVSYSVISQLVS